MISPSDEMNLVILLLRASGIHASVNNGVITATINNSVARDIRLNSISNIINNRYGLQALDISASISYKTINTPTGKSSFHISSMKQIKGESDCGCSK